MKNEMDALHSNGTIVGCRWVFTVKLSPNGSVDHLKTRLVAKGYTQIYDLNYDATFSLVDKMTSICLFLALAARHDWPLHRCSYEGKQICWLYMLIILSSLVKM